MRKLLDTNINLGKAGLLLLTIACFDKLLGITKEILIAHRFGISSVLDVFNIAMTVPGVFFSFLSGAFVSAFVPLYIGWLNQYSREQANQNALSILYCNVFFLSFLTIAAILLTPFIYQLIGYAFSPEQIQLGIRIQRWLFLLLFLEGFGITFLGLLQANKYFFCLATAPILINISVISFLIFAQNLGIFALAFGILFGIFLKNIYAFLFLKKQNFHFFSFKFDKTIVKTYYLLALPMIGSELIIRSNSIVDKIMASYLVQGSVSSLYYANKVSSLPNFMFISTVSLAILPYVSQYVSESNFEGLRNSFKNALVFIAVISFPVIAFFILFSHDIISLLLERGAFDTTATSMTSGNLFFYSLGIFFQAYALIHGSFFVALKNTKPLIYLAIISFTLNIFFNFILMQIMEVQGIALSTSLTLSIIFVISFFIIKKMIGFTQTKELFSSLLVIATIFFTLYILGILTLNYTIISNVQNLYYIFIIFVPYLFLYFLLLWKFRTREIESCFYIIFQIIGHLMNKLKQ